MGQSRCHFVHISSRNALIICRIHNRSTYLHNVASSPCPFVIFAIVGLIWIGFTTWLLFEETIFFAKASTTTGVLTKQPEMHVSHSRKSRAVSYKIDYTFFAQGKQYAGNATVSTRPESPDITVYFEHDNPIRVIGRSYISV